MPRIDIDSNANKRLVDGIAATLLDLSKNDLRRSAEEIIRVIRGRERRAVKIVVLGAAGSNKTSISHEMSTLLALPAFDLDEFIPYGKSSHPDYRKRLREGWYNLWPEIPSQSGWIIEHVEAGHPELIQLFKPRFALLLQPPVDQLLDVAKARAKASGTQDEDYRHRSMETAIKCSQSFDGLPGAVVGKGSGWTLKELQ